MCGFFSPTFSSFTFSLPYLPLVVPSTIVLTSSHSFFNPTPPPPPKKLHFIWTVWVTAIPHFLSLRTHSGGVFFFLFLKNLKDLGFLVEGEWIYTVFVLFHLFFLPCPLHVNQPPSSRISIHFYSCSEITAARVRLFSRHLKVLMFVLQ